MNSPSVSQSRIPTSLTALASLLCLLGAGLLAWQVPTGSPPANPETPTATLTTPTRIITQQTPTLTPSPTLSPTPQQTILQRVQSNGVLHCGVNGQLEGFSERQSEPDQDGFYVEASGLDADFCRAIAIAVFGTAQDKVRFTDLSTGDRYAALRTGKVDVLLRNTSWTALRDAERGLDFGAITFFTYQTFLVRANGGLKMLADLAGKRVCVLPGSTSQDHLALFQDEAKIQFTQVISDTQGREFQSNQQVADAFFAANQCDALASNYAQLRLWQENRSDSADYQFLDIGPPRYDDLRGPAVAENDSQWRDLVNYAIWATIQAEELGISQANVATFGEIATLRQKAFLGIADGRISKSIGAMLGVAPEFAKNITAQLGNYGEIYQRNLGDILPERAANQPWQPNQPTVVAGRLFSPPFWPEEVAIIDSLPPVAHATSGIVRIGIAIDRTGKDNPLGKDQQIAVDIAETLLKASYCNLTFCFEFVPADTGSDELGAQNAFRTLIEQAGVAIVIGPSYSQQALQAHAIGETAQVPMVAPSNTADGILDQRNFVVRISAPVAVYAGFAVAEVASSVQRVAVAYLENDIFTLSETAAFTRAIATSQLQLVHLEPFPKDVSDFALQASNILAATPDLVIVSGRFKDGVLLIGQLRQAGYTGKIIGGNGLNVNDIFTACGAACGEMYLAQAYDPRLQSEINKQFVQAYRDMVNNPTAFPSQISAQMFTALQITIASLHAINEQTAIQALDLPRLRLALNKSLHHSQREFDTPLGTFWLDAGGEICQSRFYVAQIKLPDQAGAGQFAIIGASHPVANTVGQYCYT